MRPVARHERRRVLLGTSAALLSPWLRPWVASGAPPADGLAPALAEVSAVERTLGGRVGLCALDTGSGARLAHRADERFAMCSTFKVLLAAAVLARVDRGAEQLAALLNFTAEDLLPYAPFVRAHLQEGALSVGALAEASVEVSDNTAANLLLRRLGGPAALTRYLRGIGDVPSRLDRNEPALNTNLSGDQRDTTTPDAMVATLHTILLGTVLAADSRQRLLLWMRNGKTGLRRLRAGLPAEWSAGDKTGTGKNGSANDVAIVWPPGRAPILVAAYLSGSKLAAEALDAAHARLGAIIARM